MIIVLCGMAPLVKERQLACYLCLGWCFQFVARAMYSHITVYQNQNKRVN